MQLCNFVVGKISNYEYMTNKKQFYFPGSEIIDKLVKQDIKNQFLEPDILKEKKKIIS